MIEKTPIVFLLPGELSAASSLLAENSSEFIVSSGKFVLDEATVRTVTKSGVTVVYGCTNSLGSPGAVAISTRRLSFFGDCTSSSDIRYNFGTDASKVFV